MGVPVTVFSLLLVLIYHPVCYWGERERGERGVARYPLVGIPFTIKLGMLTTSVSCFSTNALLDTEDLDILPIDKWNARSTAP